MIPKPKFTEFDEFEKIRKSQFLKAQAIKKFFYERKDYFTDKVQSFVLKKRKQAGDVLKNFPQYSL